MFKKTRPYFLISSLERYFPQCLDIIKTTNYSCFDEWIFHKLKEGNLLNTYPDKVLEFLNHIINANSISSIQWHADDLKELLNILAIKSSNLQELKCILEKLVPIGSQYNWALELLS